MAGVQTLGRIELFFLRMGSLFTIRNSTSLFPSVLCLFSFIEVPFSRSLMKNLGWWWSLCFPKVVVCDLCSRILRKGNRERPKEVGENLSHAQAQTPLRWTEKGKGHQVILVSRVRTRVTKKARSFSVRRLLDLVNVGNPEQIRRGSMILLSKVFCVWDYFLKTMGPINFQEIQFLFTKTTPCRSATKNRRSKQQQVLNVFPSQKWSNLSKISCQMEGGGFKYFLFSPLFGEDFQFDYIIFFRWVETTT